MATDLGWYQQDCSAFLHDYGLKFTPPAQLTRFINMARRELAERTGCIRRLVTGQSAFGASAQPGIAIPGAMQPGALVNSFPAGTVTNAAANALQTIPGVERYPYVGFFNPYLKAQYAGCEKISDIIDLAVNWGGAVRPALYWLPWDDLQAYARAYATLVTSYPYYWSVYNDGPQGEVWLFPAPSTNGDIEADATCLPIDLNTNADSEAIPDSFKDAVKFKATSLAFLTSYRYLNAQVMENMFADRLGIARVSVDRGKTSNYYYSAL